jgi:aryl-alcohol dehydrogenase-like predicted oxidoreductase/predicted kinase
MLSGVIAIGCMRLSTDPERDDERSVTVLHAALDAGVTFFDTANAYCWTNDDIGHNERLLARAIGSWSGDRSRLTIATKGGLTRPEGRWEPDGRAKHLAAACERSCRALGVTAIDLYQLHVVDPQVPLATSVRALAALKRAGLIKTIGLCNVTIRQIEEARRITDIDAVQHELSVWHDGAVLGGVVQHCIRHKIRFLAYRPLGGRKSAPRTAADAVLGEVAARHGATPFDVALAWVSDLDPLVTPLPGVTQVSTAQAAARAQQIRLTDADREVLDARFPHGRLLRERSRPHPVPATRLGAEIVMVMGIPAAGKSTLTKQFVADGYLRLNRDESGGTLRGLLPTLRRALQGGAPRIVLDNTYVTRKSRAEAIQAASELGVPVRCVWLTTSLDDAQVNAVTRLIERYGHLPDERELRQLRKTDVAAFAPSVLFRYQRELEPPDPSEGFLSILEVPFKRAANPAHVNRAVIAWCDEPSQLEALAPALRQHQDAGWIICVLSWQPGIEDGTPTDADVRASFAAVGDRAGLRFDLEICPHGAGPPRCWCRKPLPGLGVALIHRHTLDPAQCLFVGNGPQDAGFARKVGLRHVPMVAALS